MLRKESALSKDRSSVQSVSDTLRLTDYPNIPSLPEDQLVLVDSVRPKVLFHAQWTQGSGSDNPIDRVDVSLLYAHPARAATGAVLLDRSETELSYRQQLLGPSSLSTALKKSLRLAILGSRNGNIAGDLPSLPKGGTHADVMGRFGQLAAVLFEARTGISHAQALDASTLHALRQHGREETILLELSISTPPSHGVFPHVQDAERERPRPNFRDYRRIFPGE
jgi:hypothetical protein